MILLELFDKEVEKEVKRDTADFFQVRALIGTRVILFNASLTSNKTTPTPYWWISFEAPGPDKNPYALTDDGHSLEVFSFIRWCLLTLIKKHKPEMITFEATKKKGAIYKRMLEKMLPSEYKLEVDEDHDYDFQLIRK